MSWEPELRPLSQFTIYSENGQAAIHAERYRGGGVSLEIKGGELLLDKQQLQGLVTWLGMELDD